jgi:hypothetical protein
MRDRSPGKDLDSESLGGASFRLSSFFFPILRRCGGLERSKKTIRDAGNFFDGAEKEIFIGLGRFVEAADLSHELQRSGANLIVGDRRIEVEEGFDIPAHALYFNNRRVPHPSYFKGWDSTGDWRLGS